MRTFSRKHIFDSFCLLAERPHISILLAWSFSIQDVDWKYIYAIVFIVLIGIICLYQALLKAYKSACEIENYLRVYPDYKLLVMPVNELKSLVGRHSNFEGNFDDDYPTFKIWPPSTERLAKTKIYYFSQVENRRSLSSPSEFKAFNSLSGCSIFLPYKLKDADPINTLILLHELGHANILQSDFLGKLSAFSYFLPIVLIFLFCNNPTNSPIILSTLIVSQLLGYLFEREEVILKSFNDELNADRNALRLMGKEWIRDISAEDTNATAKLLCSMTAEEPATFLGKHVFFPSLVNQKGLRIQNFQNCIEYLKSGRELSPGYMKNGHTLAAFYARILFNATSSVSAIGIISYHASLPELPSLYLAVGIGLFLLTMAGGILEFVNKKLGNIVRSKMDPLSINGD